MWETNARNLRSGPREKSLLIYSAGESFFYRQRPPKTLRGLLLLSVIGPTADGMTRREVPATSLIQHFYAGEEQTLNLIVSDGLILLFLIVYISESLFRKKSSRVTHLRSTNPPNLVPELTPYAIRLEIKFSPPYPNYILCNVHFFMCEPQNLTFYSISARSRGPR
jgi:hypothetical protein